MVLKNTCANDPGKASSMQIQLIESMSELEQRRGEDGARTNPADKDSKAGAGQQ